MGGHKHINNDKPVFENYADGRHKNQLKILLLFFRLFIQPLLCLMYLVPCINPNDFPI